ncbi:MAG: acyl carrier protein [Candidatus Anaerobiospirillum pullicola]|uniref:Acyl carrier protein n=1 Tax=Candidatus Anaerobiospirillum pullicola TaxID=2838451 RepID=A0A948TGY6_9GAMM|nr:acyl carrier protein [Candidatus Anaerobiospirillum pullicola]
MDNQSFLEAVAEIFDEDPASMTMMTALQDLPKWDSLTFMALATMLQDKFGQQVELHRLMQCETPQDLLDLVK